MTSQRLAAGLRRFVGRTSAPSANDDSDIRRSTGRNAGKGLLAIADQAIVSGVNFATGLILARYLSQASFGYYALLFAALLFIWGLHSSLINVPLMVFMPSYSEEKRGAYLNSLWILHLASCLIVGLVVVALIPVVRQWWPGIMAVGIVPLVLAVLSYLTQDFLRRALFAQQRSMNGLTLDVLSYGLQFLALIVLIRQSMLSLESTIWAMALTSLISCIYGIVKLGLRADAVSRAQLRTTWQQHWDQGSWLAGSTLAQWGSTQIYVFVVAWLLSAASSAVLVASRNLLGVTHMFMLGLENFVPTMATRQLLQGGPNGLMHWLNRLRFIIGAVMGVYCLLAAVFAKPLMQLLFGAQYTNAGPIVALIALMYFISTLARPAMIGLRAMKETRWIFYAYCVSSIVTLFVSVPLVRAGGVVGAAFGMILTQVLLLIVLSIGYRRKLQSMRATSTAGDTAPMATM